MIRPRLAETIEALGRALTSAEVRGEELHSVLLMGGSSRIPLVQQLVAAELGRPTGAVDAQAVAEGAAWLAGRHLRHAVEDATAPSPPRVPDHTPDAALPPSHVAVPDVAGRRGGSRPRTKAVTASDPISRAVRSSISMGLIAFNPPDRMRQGHGDRVEVEIARSLQLRDEIARGLRGRGDPVVEEIRTSQFMGVQLLGRAFYIDELSPREQLVPSMARWEFNVTPKRAGNQVLILCATMMIQTPRGDGLIAVPVLERDVDVQVDVRYGARSFISHNWQWLTATCIGLGGAISAWATLIR
jgi:Hsp70 protein